MLKSKLNATHVTPKVRSILTCKFPAFPFLIYSSTIHILFGFFGVGTKLQTKRTTPIAHSLKQNPSQPHQNKLAFPISVSLPPNFFPPLFFLGISHTLSMKGLYGESVLRGQVLVEISEEVMKVRDLKSFSAYEIG